MANNNGSVVAISENIFKEEWLFFKRSTYFISFQVIINVYILEIVRLVLNILKVNVM